MSYILRQATTDDYDFLYRLHKATLEDYVTRTWGQWDESSQTARFKANFDSSDYQIVLVDGEDAGEVCVVRRETEIFLASIEILPEYQGQGIGTALIEDIIAEANRSGLPIALQVLKVNPARRLYERLGFVVFGETATHYLMRRDADVAPLTPR